MDYVVFAEHPAEEKPAMGDESVVLVSQETLRDAVVGPWVARSRGGRFGHHEGKQ